MRCQLPFAVAAAPPLARHRLKAKVSEQLASEAGCTLFESSVWEWSFCDDCRVTWGAKLMRSTATRTEEVWCGAAMAGRCRCIQRIGGVGEQPTARFAHERLRFGGCSRGWIPEKQAGIAPGQGDAPLGSPLLKERAAVMVGKMEEIMLPFLLAEQAAFEAGEETAVPTS